MLNRNCHHRVGPWQVEFEKDDGIAGDKKRADEANVLETFRFFNEIGIIAQLSQNLFESVMPHRLTLSQFSVLNHFVRIGKTESPARLARAFQVTRGAMTNTLGRLEKQGFVKICPDQEDGRAKIVEITGAGKVAQADCIAAVTPKLVSITGNVGAEGFADALPQLELLRKYLDASRN